MWRLPITAGAELPVDLQSGLLFGREGKKDDGPQAGVEDGGETPASAGGASGPF